MLSAYAKVEPRWRAVLHASRCHPRRAKQTGWPNGRSLSTLCLGRRRRASFRPGACPMSARWQSRGPRCTPATARAMASATRELPRTEITCPHFVGGWQRESMLATSSTSPRRYFIRSTRVAWRHKPIQTPTAHHTSQAAAGTETQALIRQLCIQVEATTIKNIILTYRRLRLDLIRSSCGITVTRNRATAVAVMCLGLTTS
jgi:hypothetical protein